MMINMGYPEMKQNIIATNNNKRGESPEKEMYYEENEKIICLVNDIGYGYGIRHNRNGRRK